MVKNLPAHADVCWTHGLGISPGGGNGNLLQYSCWKNPMDRGAWWATVHVVTESDVTEPLSMYAWLVHHYYKEKRDFNKLAD